MAVPLQQECILVAFTRGFSLKILIVHEVSYKKKPVYEYQDFAERLAARGHEVTVIDFDEAGSGDDRESIISRTGLAKVRHQPISHVNFPVLNVLHARRTYQRNLEKALRAKTYDVAFVYSVFVNGTTTVKLFKKFGIPVVYRVLDIYHKIRENPLIKFPLLIGEKYIYRNSNLVLTTNQKLSDYVRELRKNKAEPEIIVLEHGVDCNHFRPVQKNSELMKKLGLTSNDKVLLYLGTTYSFSGLDVILNALPELQSKLGSVKFMIVGGGELDEKLNSMAAELGQEKNFIHLGMQPYDKLPELLSLADIVLNPFKINDITCSIIPIKMLQYLASGKPSISAPINDLMKLIPPEPSGVRYVAIEDEQSFVSQIENILKLSETERNQLGEQGRAFALTKLSVDKQIDKLELYFNKLVVAIPSQPSLDAGAR